MIAIFYAVKAESAEPWEGLSIKEEIRLDEWQKGKHKGVVRKGEYRGQEIVLAQTGIWRSSKHLGNTQSREVAEFVLARYPIDKVLIIGTSGGLKENLKTGDIVICNPIYAERRTWLRTKVLPPLYPDQSLTILAEKLMKERDARFYIGGDLMIAYYGWPKRRYPEMVVVEMEDYWIGSIASEKKIPFLAARVVLEPFEEKIIPEGKRAKEYQTWLSERFQRVSIILRNEFLLPFLQRL